MLMLLRKPNLYISHRKRRKKIRVMIIESKNGSSESEIDDDNVPDAIPGPPPGSPKLYHTVEFIKKFAVVSQEFKQTSTLATSS